MNPTIVMTSPMGKFAVDKPCPGVSKVGMIKGGGAVKVGILVAGISSINSAAKVGSIVFVIRGVGSGGGSIIGNSPPLVIVTKGE